VIVVGKWKWLESTYKLQSQTYHYDLEGMVDAVKDGAVDAVDADYFDWNATAAVQELAELREEFSWKPWATDMPFINRDRIRDEAVDVLHFVGNMMVALGVTDKEFWEAYEQKQELNRQRKASGTYSAKKGGLTGV
jgi:dimeric dUTPase (all-alpha-NTP-PPase superfamily)